MRDLASWPFKKLKQLLRFLHSKTPSEKGLKGGICDHVDYCQ